MLVIAVVASVQSNVDMDVGVGGKLEELMTVTEPASLNKLGRQHIRTARPQPVPMKANTGSATDWDFSILDAIVCSARRITVRSFKIAVAPSFLNDPTTGHFIFGTPCRRSPTTAQTW